MALKSIVKTNAFKIADKESFEKMTERIYYTGKISYDYIYHDIEDAWYCRIELLGDIHGVIKEGVEYYFNANGTIDDSDEEIFEDEDNFYDFFDVMQEYLAQDGELKMLKVYHADDIHRPGDLILVCGKTTLTKSTSKFEVLSDFM